MFEAKVLRAQFTDSDRLSRATLLALLFGVFVVAVGYGFVLPVLPFLIEQLAGTTDGAVVSRHTGIATGTYMTALVLFPSLWGRLADRWGRRRVMVIGLVGLGSSLAIFSLFSNLYLLYLGRFLDGLFAAAVTPAALALISASASSDEWRARRLAWLSMAGVAGFLVGPMLGGLVIWVAEWLRLENVYDAPFLATTALAYSAAVVAAIRVPRAIGAVETELPLRPAVVAASHVPTVIIPRLLLISLAVAAALGAFEVTLALRGKQILGMSPFQVGLMFVECSFVMFVAQGAVFSPLVKPERTRWFFTPALALAAIALVALPWISSFALLLVVVGIVAASIGILYPIATYWVSLAADEAQGRQLGRHAAMASLGQAAGSVGAGLLFGIPYVPEASVVASVGLLVVVAANLNLPRLLAPLTSRSARGRRWVMVPLTMPCE